ncbi:hypothetical protein ABPG75_003750 [Micractinium tetrahymenae]
MPKRPLEQADIIDLTLSNDEEEAWRPSAQRQQLQGAQQLQAAGRGAGTEVGAAATSPAPPLPTTAPPRQAPPRQAPLQLAVTNQLLAQLHGERHARHSVREQQSWGHAAPAAGAAAAALSLVAATAGAASSSRYAAVEVLPQVRRMAEHHLRLLQAHHGRGALPDSAIAGAHTALPQDVCKVTADHIRALGPIDVVTAGFPCQDLSRSKKGEQLGLRGRNLGLFYQAAQIVEWAKESNPNVVFVFENVKFSSHSEPAIAEDDWRTVQRLLGPGREDRDLATSLDSCHRPRVTDRSDPPAFPPGIAPFNRQGGPARKYPTVCRTWRPEDGAYSALNGTAFVVRRDSGREELPFVHEVGPAPAQLLHVYIRVGTRQRNAAIQLP